MEQICSVRECKRTDINSRNMCNKHYARYRRHGDPLGGRERATRGIAESMAAHTSPQGECQVWTGAKVRNGYGVVSYNGKRELAHRVAYELSNGTIPDGLVIDHVCHNRACVNAAHLRAVTQKQNLENNGEPNSRNKSGVRGVYWSAASGKWIAQVCHNYKKRHLGSFAVLADAEAAVIKARKALFTHNDLDRMA